MIRPLPQVLKTNLMQRVARSFLSLIFPATCLNCSEGLSDEHGIFCQACLELLELINPSERCPYCFSSNFSSGDHCCIECYKMPPLFNGTAAAFDYAGPASCLIRNLKYSNKQHLAKGGAAFMAAQFLQLNWPMPDIVLSVPIAFNRWIDRGYNQSSLLAKHLAEFINCPFKEGLKRSCGDYSQAGLSRRQRMELKGRTITLKKGVNFRDSCVLLVDDVMTTGTTMRRCAEAILEQGPGSIYGLTLCRALK